jgi:ubiquitin-small subunit ribosomal protein S27Ae
VQKFYKISSDGKLTRLNLSCPRCGPGFFMANNYDRLTCGHCGFTEFKKRGPKKARPEDEEEEEMEAEVKPETKPAAKPPAKPGARPAAKPSSKPGAKPTAEKKAPAAKSEEEGPAKKK